MSLSKELAEALADTVAKQHPAFRSSTNWQPYRGPRGGEGYINTHTGDVVYGDTRPGGGWDEDGDIEVDESFQAAPDGYEWERPPMNYDVKDQIEEANPDNVDGFLEAKFSGDQVIYEDGQSEEAPHSWGRVTGARVDTYTNLGGHEVTGVVLELEGSDDVPLNRVLKHVDTSKDPKYEAWQLADENPHESDLEDVSEKVYHSFSHDEFQWKEYADWRNDAKALPVLSERGADDLWAAMGAYFDRDSMDDLRTDLASWKSDSDRGTGRYSDIAKEVFEIDAVSRDNRYGEEWDTSNEEDFKRAVEILSDVSRRFYEDQYEGDDLFRGISRHGFRSLVKGWLENPGADEFEVEHRALANYSADHRVARDWAGNTVVIQPDIDPEDIVLAIDGLNFSGVHNTESEVHMRGDRITLKPDDVNLKTRRDTQGRTPWPERKAGLSEPAENWSGDDAENFSRAISLIYDDETPDEETALRFLRIAKAHEDHIEDRLNSERFNFERDRFFTTGTAGPGEVHGEVIEWENEYLDLLGRIEAEHGLNLSSVEKAENPPGSPDETPVVDLTEDWFLSPEHRNDAERAEKQVTNVQGEWVPYQGPRGGEGWQRISDQEVVYQDDPPGDVVEGIEENFWERYGEGDESQDTSGYYDADEWDDAFEGMNIAAPSDVPEGAELHYVSSVGNHHWGRVTGYEYGENIEGADPTPAYLKVVSDDGFEASVTADQIEEITDTPHEAEIPEFEWDTDIPPINELQEGADVLYEGENGVRRVGEYERPTFVQTEEGTFGGAILEDGTEIRLQDMVAVDEGPVPLEPREDPFEFESVVNEGDFRGLRAPDETWDNLLEFTPFDDLGEVPLGATVEFDTPKLNGTIEGEVTGYIDYDAEIGETNSLRVQTEDDYVGETTVGPSNFVRFIGPEGDQDLSLEEYLSNPFEHAHKVEGSREAGITGGNTTGEKMKIATMPDDSLIFATPLEAYNHITTGVVDSAAEARENNLNSPIMIDHLGGGACKTRIVEGPDGSEYIAKEGIEGDDLRSRQWSIDENDDAELMDSLARTTAAAFFVGNQDLHSHNIRVNFDTQEATVIDHDAAGGSTFGGGFMDVQRIVNDPLSTSQVENEIYDIARDYMRGDLDVPEELEGTKHESYFMDAIDKLANEEHHSDLFEPWGGDPHSLPRHADSMDDFTEGQEVTVLTDDGHVRTGELTQFYQGTWYGETDDNYEISFDMPHHVLSSEEPQVPIVPTEESQELMDALTDAGEEQTEYNELTDLEAGMGITINQGFSDENVVVEDVDTDGPVTQVLVRPTDGGDPFHVNQWDDVVQVGRERNWNGELDDLNTGEEIQVEDEDGEEISGTFMGYTDGSDGEQIEIQDAPGRIVTVDAPRNVQRLTGDSQ